MTTERQPAAQELDAPAPALDQFEITDETTPEQRALEAQMLAEPDEGEADGEAPAPVSEAPAEAPPVSQTPTPAEPKAETPQPELPTPPRLEDSPEWRKAQSKWMQQVQAEKKRADEAERRAAEREAKENLEAKIEAELRRQETRYSTQFGEEDAKRLARDPENVRLVRENAEKDQKLQQAEIERQQIAVGKAASDLSAFITKLRADHGLDDDDVQSLAAFVTPATFSSEASYMATGEAIGALAVRLGNKNRTTAAAQQAKRSLVPPETAATKPETGASPGSGPMTHDQMLARVRVKPASQWTDKEREFMRTGRL